MEYVFEVFFEESFRKLERSGLKSRKSRRDVIDHLNAVISGCIEGRQTASAQLAVALAVKSAIDYHRKMKYGNHEVCMMGKFHNVLYIAVRVAWDWSLEDSEVIRTLLEEIYQCENTFERIFLGALFGANAPHFIAGWKSDFKDQDENLRALVFFLHHAGNSKLCFPHYSYAYHNTMPTKFIDIPIESCGKAAPLRTAIQASAPDIVMILLRHGADPNPDDGGAPPIISLLDKLRENENRSYPYQLVSCLKLLLTCTVMIELPYKPHLFHVRKEMFELKYGTLLQDNLIPREQVFGVPKLKLICRCHVRNLLRNAFQLPRGIAKLAVPRKIKKYIDLLD
ncbi:conserved hypothetical protein [Culex quinquefasciatus]|uniref:SOCS box domain-containing protein n=1 Tax=Culex quinquefasciatus TaxID=7176 RepID=B0XCR8_CULQU|nr:uncharacterized protein LOC6050924 [Culex quinquefasciatus]EDS45085.1 conserved hypothetical protein [Culex quinquefasciatus]|eukprot:XP_001867440.1 conserved hypothetical protein [Culex quinquefasciatus]